MTVKQPTIHPLGVYFDLDETEYHLDGALSSTGVRLLKKSPLKYWYASVLNPSYDPEPLMKYGDNLFKAGKTKDARRIGRIHHLALFEPEKYEANYFIAEVGKWVVGKKHVTAAEGRDIGMATSVIRTNPRMNRMLSGGFGEVSIFFDYCGVVFRARIDYINVINGQIWLVDYKTVKDVDMLDLRWSIRRFEYDIQAALYREAVRWLQYALVENEVEALIQDDVTEEKINFLKSIAAATDIHWINLFQERTKPYAFAPKRLTAPVLDAALPEIQQAAPVYSNYLQKYGISMWPSNASDKIEDVFLDDLPGRV